MYHPCQALADYLSLTEVYGDIKNKTIAYIGDGNNVTHSLNILGVLLGCHQIVITPKGFEVDASIADEIQKMASENNVSVVYSNDINDLQNADVLYTDTWLSMGDNTPLSDIKKQFMPYQVNQELMTQSGAEYVMHCQPAHRDLEITGELMDSQYSLLMRQSENRLHAQNAILCNLLTNLKL